MIRTDALLRKPWSGSDGDSRRWLVAGCVVLVAIFLAVDPQWTVQSIRSPGQSAVTSSGNFDPADYVRKHWATEIMPTVHNKAVSLSALLAGLKSDPAGTARRYGHTAELGGQPTFLVKGAARVVSVNTANIPAQASIALGPGRKVDAELQLGPILTGTDVRDAMRFISFNQFSDQVTYAELATAINRRIEQTALDRIDNGKLTGRTVSFYGAFTYTPGMTPLVTPVTLELAR
jgi:predicted lipoprotein